MTQHFGDRLLPGDLTRVTCWGYMWTAERNSRVMARVNEGELLLVLGKIAHPVLNSPSSQVKEHLVLHSGSGLIGAVGCLTARVTT